MQELLREISPESRDAWDMHRSELRFRRRLEMMPVAAYTCDPDGLITYFNLEPCSFGDVHRS